EPPAAPAQFIIGPVGAHRDTARQEYPRCKRPRPYPARPRRVDPALDESCHREGKADGKADIAEIKQRGMHRQSDVLQNGIEVTSLDWSRVYAGKRIGSGEDEQQKCCP